MQTLKIIIFFEFFSDFFETIFFNFFVDFLQKFGEFTNQFFVCFFSKRNIFYFFVNCVINGFKLVLIDFIISSGNIFC